jgi:hypothetical protein
LLVLPPATPARGELDLTLRREGDPDTWIRPTLRLDAVGAAESNAWAGNSRGLLGEHTNGWGEFGVTPGLEGQIASNAAGTLHARVSGVYATTQFGLDAAGSNFEDRYPRETSLEDAYVGWTSGDLLPALGEDAIGLSVGAQPYSVGTGFLFADGASDGGERGAFWLGPRQAFRMTAIGRLRTGALLAEGVYLRPNDEPYTHTDVAGLNLQWSFGERATLGAGWWNAYDSQDERRDGLDVFDVRLAAAPRRRAPALRPAPLRRGRAREERLAERLVGRLRRGWLCVRARARKGPTRATALRTSPATTAAATTSRSTPCPTASPTGGPGTSARSWASS